MSRINTFWTLLLAVCVLFQSIITPVVSAPTLRETKEAEERQALTPSQFSLAATRFIVLLPFLPLLMFVPGVTGVLMPMVMALQDRLATIAPNMNRFTIFGNRPSANATNGGTVSNPGSARPPAPVQAETTTTAAPTSSRVKRGLLGLATKAKTGLLRLPTKALDEGFKEVFEILEKTDDALNLLTSSQPDCRRQAVCRLNSSFDPSLGKFLGNIFEVLKLESKVEKLDVSDTTRSILKEVLQAANTGLFQQDCSVVYSRCSVIVSNRKP